MTLKLTEHFICKSYFVMNIQDIYIITDFQLLFSKFKFLLKIRQSYTIPFHIIVIELTYVQVNIKNIKRYHLTVTSKDIYVIKLLSLHRQKAN